MRVLKSINNNVVSCRDETGREWIAMERGLGFSLRPGDVLDEAKVEKRFRMETPDEARRLADLFASLPAQQIELCSQIVDRAARDLGRRLSPSVYLTLTDHNCITRLRLEVKDRLLVDEKKLKASGAAGVVRPGKTSVQVIIGPKVQFVADEFKKLVR